MFFKLKRITFVIILLAASCIVNAAEYGKSSSGYTQKGNFELGGGFGTPSGLNARYWFTERFGLDANAGVSLDKQPVFTLDFLVENYKLYRSSTFESRFFYGLGCLVLKDGDDYKNNVRIPFGLSFPLMQYPINFSFYIAPALVINPKTEFDINWGIGVRYNFSRAAEIMEKQYHLEREVGKLERDVEGLKQGLDTTKGKLAEKEGELTATKGKLNELTVKLGNIKSTLDKTEGELGTTKGELGATKTKLLLTTKELDDTKNQLDDVRSELGNTKKSLDDKQIELNKRQAELAQAKIIIENAYTGKEKEEEESKTAVKQKELNEQLLQLKNEKKSWEKIKEKESERRLQLRKKCEDRGGIIDENGYCTCPENQEWDPKTDKCVCVKGYYRDKPFEKCKPCETIKESGECAGGNCEDYEEKVQLKKGPHKYVCVKRCRKSNEVWSKRKGECACRDGYYRSNDGECAKRQ